VTPVSIDVDAGLTGRILNLLDCGVIVLDADARILVWNGWLVPRSGRAAPRVVGESLLDVFPDLRGSRVEAAVLAALTEGTTTVVPPSTGRSPFLLRAAGSFDGAVIEQAVTVTPFRDAGQAHCLIEIRDITGSAERERRLFEHAESLRARSYIDGLTGIANRRHFDVALERELRRVQRIDGELSLLLMDIDSFKAYNDHFGHQQGDASLIEVAQAIDRLLKRPADMAARYGGEEFVAILPDTTLEQALVVAESLRVHVAGLGLQQAPGVAQPGITLSIGVASYETKGLNTPTALIAAADAALYAAKRSGRDRVVAHGDPQAGPGRT